MLRRRRSHAYVYINCANALSTETLTYAPASSQCIRVCAHDRVDPLTDFLVNCLQSLGWNIPYDFNNADFSICEDILALYLDEYPDRTPYDAHAPLAHTHAVTDPGRR